MTPEAMAALHGRAFARGWSARTFSDLLADANVLCECSDHGFALARNVGDEAELLTLAVEPEAHRRGHGRRLLQGLCARLRARGVARLLLDVAEDNDAARALYAQGGFTLDGRRAGYYPRSSGAVDALLLSRSL